MESKRCARFEADRQFEVYINCMKYLYFLTIISLLFSTKAHVLNRYRHFVKNK
jgi:hypothetical protein